MRIITFAVAAAALSAVQWAGPGSAGRSSATVSDPCAAVVEHTPSPDVAYRPGVDVTGRPVVPADLNAPALDLPQELSFEITVPMRPRDARHFGRNAYFGEALVGFLTLHADGTMSFNGRPLDGGSQAALHAACAEALRRR